MKLLSIDQSLSSTGIIIWEDELKWQIAKSTKGDDVVVRIRTITEQIGYLIKTHKITHVVIESLPYGINSTSVRPLAGLYYCIANLCKDMKIEFAEANVTGVKKFATGSGKAKKEDMIAAAIKAQPVLFENIAKLKIKKTTGLADLADAYWIGAYYRNQTTGAEWPSF